MSSFDQVIKNILSDLFGSNEQEDVVRSQARPSGLGAPTTSPRPRLRPEQDDDDEVAIPSGTESTSKFIAAMADFDDTPEEGVDIPLSTLQTDARNLNGKYKTTAMQLAKLNKAAPLTDGGRANVRVAGIEEDTTVQDLLSEIEMVMDPLSSIRPRARPLSNMEARAREIRAGTFTKKDRMKTIQQDLNAQGILINGKPLVIDGIQGGENSNTTKAIKAFQKREGLTVDGKVGPVTREALLKYTVPESNITEEVLETVSAGRNEPRTERERIQAILDRDDFVESDFSLSAAEPTIVVSSNVTKSKEEKKDVQRALTELGYEVGAIDGVIGSRTIKAIRQFQKDKKLNPDGTVGTNTAAAMNEALTKGLTEDDVVTRISTKGQDIDNEKGWPFTRVDESLQNVEEPIEPSKLRQYYNLVTSTPAKLLMQDIMGLDKNIWLGQKTLDASVFSAEELDFFRERYKKHGLGLLSKAEQIEDKEDALQVRTGKDTSALGLDAASTAYYSVGDTTLKLNDAGEVILEDTYDYNFYTDYGATPDKDGKYPVIKTEAFEENYGTAKGMKDTLKAWKEGRIGFMSAAHNIGFLLGSREYKDASKNTGAPFYVNLGKPDTWS